MLRIAPLFALPLAPLLAAACAKPPATITIAAPTPTVHIATPSSPPAPPPSAGAPEAATATLQVATATTPPPPPPRPPQPPLPPSHTRPARVAPPMSDGAGPRITFGRAFTERLLPGFYGRFETEYFEVRDVVITGMLLGLEGWGTEGATAGGFAIPVSLFAGGRGGPGGGPKSPVLFATAGIGIDVLVYDRIGQIDGFGLLSPFCVATAGVEAVPGVRLLADARAAYRWHWTARSNAQYQIGFTLGLNSYLWDGP